MNDSKREDELASSTELGKSYPQGIFFNKESRWFFESGSFVALTIFSGFFFLLHFIPTFIAKERYSDWGASILLTIAVIVYVSFTVEVMVFNRFFPESLAGRSLDLRATRLFLILLLPGSVYLSYRDYSLVFAEPNNWLLVTLASGLLLYLAVTKRFFNPHREVISGACRIVENYISSVPINPDWPLERLGSLCSIEEGRISVDYLSSNGTVPYVKPEDLTANEIDIVTRLIAPEEATGTFKDILGNWVSELVFIPAGSILFHFKGSNLIQKELSFTQIFSDVVIDRDIAALVPDTKRVEPKFLAIIVRQLKDSLNFYSLNHTSTEWKWRLDTFRMSDVLIPVPPMDIQKKIVAQIEIEERAVRACKELVRRAGWRRSLRRHSKI
jgi:hypothetical protein